MRNCTLALLSLAVCLAVGGCSGGWSSAGGSVTLDGKALEEGNITFVPEAEGPTAYGSVKNGSFSVSTGQQAGLPIGKYKVTVRRQSIPESGSKEPAKLLTPVRYSDPLTSGLEADVKSGSNSFKFELFSKP